MKIFSYFSLSNNRLVKLFYKFPILRPDPPYYMDNMESKCGHWKGVSSAKCVEGRQLGENNTYPCYARETIKTEYVVTHMQGSRNGCPINHTALQSIMNNWSTALYIIGLLRDQYIKKIAKNKNNLDYLDLFILTKICNSIPSYLLRNNAISFSNGEIPSPVAAIYKIVTGVHTVIGEMILEGDENIYSDKPVSSNYFYSFADNNNLFSSMNGQVCGGPKHKIEELIEYLVTGKKNIKSLSSNIDNFLFNVGSIEKIFEYGVNCANLDIQAMLYSEKIISCVINSNLDVYLQNESDKNIYASLQNLLKNIAKSNNFDGVVYERRLSMIKKLAQRSVSHEKLCDRNYSDHELELAEICQNCSIQFKESLMEMLIAVDNASKDASANIILMQKNINSLLGVGVATEIDFDTVLDRAEDSLSKWIKVNLVRISA